jgi:hypothetical protein
MIKQKTVIAPARTGIKICGWNSIGLISFDGNQSSTPSRQLSSGASRLFGGIGGFGLSIAQKRVHERVYCGLLNGA